MSHAFAPESMAHCAAKGHRWRQVRAWNAVGWHECYCCGETRGGLDGPAPVESSPPPATVGAPQSSDLQTLCDRSRTMVREGAHAAAAARVLSENVVGKGQMECTAESGKLRALVAEFNANYQRLIPRPPESVAPPSPQSPTEEPARYADATPPRKPRPPRAPVGTRPHGGHNRKAERDREVLALLAAGRPGKEIATHFGLTESRISQIKKAAAAAQGAV